jgi:Mrp family chromosome partitioning ATPase
MIDVQTRANDRINGHAAGKNGRIYHDDYSPQEPVFGVSEGNNFSSFQYMAEQALREQEPTTALTLADESAVMFRALPLMRAEIEKIRSEIQVLHQRHGTLSLGFASAQSGEGTSTILANLIMDLKRTNLRILVVDLNVRHANLPGLFSLPDSPGLIDLVHGRRRLTDVVRVIKAHKIFLLPLGKLAKTTPFELETAVRAINKAGKNSKYFDLILFDFPPLNQLPQGLYAARQIDGLIQIVQAERTRVEVVRTLKHRLEHLGIQLFGVVLNQRRFYIPKFIYENL